MPPPRVIETLDCTGPPSRREAFFEVGAPHWARRTGSRSVRIRAAGSVAHAFTSVARGCLPTKSCTSEGLRYKSTRLRSKGRGDAHLHLSAYRLPALPARVLVLPAGLCYFPVRVSTSSRGGDAVRRLRCCIMWHGLRLAGVPPVGHGQEPVRILQQREKEGHATL